MPTCRKFDVYELHLFFFFWDIVKILQTHYFQYFENAWSCPSVITVSSCRKLWCPKCWNQLVGNLDVSLHAKNQLHIWKNVFACLFSVHNTIMMEDVSPMLARWWEKYLSKRSPIIHTCSWHDKLIVLQPTSSLTTFF